MKIVPLYEQKQNSSGMIIFAAWIIAGLVLALSFFIEHAEKIEPCQLCKWQRVPYFCIFLVAPFFLSANFRKIVKFILQLSFSACLLLASFHLMVQMDFIADTCSMPQNIHTLENFHHLLETPQASCAKITWKILGIPISMYNFILSLVFIFLLKISQFNFYTIKN